MCVCLCASAEYNRHLVSLRKIVPPLELIYPQPATTILIRNGRDSKNVNVRFRLELGNFWPYTYGCTSEIVRYNRYCTLKGFYFFFSRINGGRHIPIVFHSHFSILPTNKCIGNNRVFSCSIRQTRRRKHTHRRAAGAAGLFTHTTIFYTRDAHQTKTVIILLKYRKPYILIYYNIAMIWYSERRTCINRATCCRDSNNWRISYYM